MEYNDARSDKIFRWACLAVVAVALCTIFLHAVAISAISQVWDDAYMSFRYAHSIAAHGVLSWNGTTPTFGVTSIAQILAVLPLAAVWNNPAAVMTTVSLIEMTPFLITVPFLVASVFPKSEPLARSVGVAASFALIALGNPDFGSLAASGMDTMLDLAFVSFYLIVMLRTSRTLGSMPRMRLIGVGVLGALAFLVRPDLMLFTVLLPLSLALWLPSKTERRKAWFILICTAIVLAMILIAAWAYFGTPLPLSFFAKSGGHVYGPITVSIQKFQPILQLLFYIDTYKFLVAALLVAALFGWRRIFVRGEHALVIGMVASVVAFILYYLFFVIQYMGYLGRFYYPTLPVLLVLMCVVLARALATFSGAEAQRARRAIALGSCVIMLVLLYTPFVWGMEQIGYAVQARAEVKVAWAQNITALYQWGDYERARWPCLDVWAALPNDASVATTEIGMPSVIALDKPVVDLSGLQSNDIALGHLSRIQVVLEDKVDLVYLPAEQYYPDMRQELLSSPSFGQQYEIFYRSITEQQDVAVRKDSPYAATLEQCLSKAIPPGGAEYPPIANTYYLSFPYPLTAVTQ
jgi:hypothetical protein